MHLHSSLHSKSGHGPNFQIDDLMGLLGRLGDTLDLPQSYEDTTGGDVHAVSDRNTGKSQLVDHYNKGNRSHDELIPFRQLLAGYDGREMTIGTLWDILWRLVAGRDEMLKGETLAPALPAAGQPEDFWEGLFVESCGYAPPTLKGKLQLALRFRIMGGRYGGLRFDQNITYFMVVRKIAKEIGFPKYKRTHYNELVKCVFIGHVLLEKRGDRLVPRVDEYHVTDSVKRINTGVRKKRSQPCNYQGYTWPCYQCSRGYLEAGLVRCEKAVRPYALVRKPCLQCQRESFFDLDSGSKVCVSCQAAPYKRLEK